MLRRQRASLRHHVMGMLLCNQVMRSLVRMQKAPPSLSFLLRSSSFTSISLLELPFWICIGLFSQSIRTRMVTAAESQPQPNQHIGGVKGDIFPSYIANDGYTKHEGDGETTATCFCGRVQYAFVRRAYGTSTALTRSRCLQPIRGKGIAESFTCHCTDCRKVSASMFATNFTVRLSHLQLVRGSELLKSYGQSATIGRPRNGHTMTNTWCDNCGSLMHRASSGFPEVVFMRVGQVDDFALHETAFKPQVEQFTKDRVSWLHPAQGVKQLTNMIGVEEE